MKLVLANDIDQDVVFLAVCQVSWHSTTFLEVLKSGVMKERSD